MDSSDDCSHIRAFFVKFQLQSDLRRIWAGMRKYNMALSSIEDAAKDIRDGKMIIIVDDEDRENEGDLVCAAEKVTPEIINFMAVHGRGLICLPLTEERCNELQLYPQTTENTSSMGTAFTTSASV